MAVWTGKVLARVIQKFGTYVKVDVYGRHIVIPAAMGSR